MKVWELRQALADVSDDALVVLRIHPAVAGWPRDPGAVRHLDAEMMVRLEVLELELGARGRPALALVDEAFAPDMPTLPPPVRCAVIEAWVRDRR